MADSFDAVVVGSGFGGGITACRLAQAGRSVCVLERGRRFGPDDFISEPIQAPELLWHPVLNPGGIFDLRLFKDLDVLTASGVGGGSLMTPILVLLFGIHPATAVGTDLLYAATTKAVGTAVHNRHRTV